MAISTMMKRTGALVTAAGAAMMQSAQAALPATAAPTRGDGGTNFITTLQNYSFDIITLIALIVGAVMFVLVVKNALTVYHQIGEGKASYTQLAGVSTVGVLLLVFSVYMLTQAIGVL